MNIPFDNSSDFEESFEVKQTREHLETTEAIIARGKFELETQTSCDIIDSIIASAMTKRVFGDIIE